MHHQLQDGAAVIAERKSIHNGPKRRDRGGIGSATGNHFTRITLTLEQETGCPLFSYFIASRTNDSWPFYRPRDLALKCAPLAHRAKAFAESASDILMPHVASAQSPICEERKVAARGLGGRERRGAALGLLESLSYQWALKTWWSVGAQHSEGTQQAMSAFAVGR